MRIKGDYTVEKGEKTLMGGLIFELRLFKLLSWGTVEKVTKVLARGGT